MIAIILPFVVVIVIRYRILIENLGSLLVVSTYITFFAYALFLYVLVFLAKNKSCLEHQSYREILLVTLVQQIVFITGYIMFFFVFKQELNISRVVVGLLFCRNVILCSLLGIIYHNYCVKRNEEMIDRAQMLESNGEIRDLEGLKYVSTRYCYVIGDREIIGTTK